MITITGASGDHHPILLDGYETSQQSRHVVHELLDGESIAITLRPAGPRRGTLRALFATYEEAIALNADLAEAAVLTLEDTDNPAIDMSFIAIDSSTASAEDQTRILGVSTFTYLKVPAV